MGSKCAHIFGRAADFPPSPQSPCGVAVGGEVPDKVAVSRASPCHQAFWESSFVPSKPRTPSYVLGKLSVLLAPHPPSYLLESPQIPLHPCLAFCRAFKGSPKNSKRSKAFQDLPRVSETVQGLRKPSKMSQGLPSTCKIAQLPSEVSSTWWMRLHP